MITRVAWFEPETETGGHSGQPRACRVDSAKVFLFTGSWTLEIMAEAFDPARFSHPPVDNFVGKPIPQLRIDNVKLLQVFTVIDVELKKPLKINKLDK